MRMAGSPEVYDALAQHFESDGVPEGAANHMAAEVTTHGTEFDSGVERFMEIYKRLIEQGYDRDAAQHLAVEMLEQESQEYRE
jgi:hypothetical protein